VDVSFDASLDVSADAAGWMIVGQGWPAGDCNDRDEEQRAFTEGPLLPEWPLASALNPTRASTDAPWGFHDVHENSR
jgi:hypothetical protein